MKPKDFIIGTLIGTIPRSIFYAWIGNSLFPGGVEDILAAYEAGHLDFEEKLAEVSGSFNLILTLTIIIVGGGLALFQFGVLPKMRRDAEKEVRQAKALEAAGNQTVERDDSEPESQEMSNSQNKNQLKNS
jgi:uncharacterized membrane protein YdjX (TVP38/TMEM64 family)